MIYLCIDGIPPSANNAYFNLPKGGRALTKVGKKYLAETKTQLTQDFREALAQFVKNEPYVVVYRLWFESLETKGFPKTADARYKRFDVSNRIKLLEDALKSIAGIDDSQFMTLAVTKAVGTPERTEIWAWNLDREGSPLDAALASLQRA